MSESGIRKGERVFYDDVYFPQGFARSEVFSITEATLLQDYGTTLKQLYDGFLHPLNEIESRFVKVSSGQLAPTSSLERVWIKYVKATSPRGFKAINGKRERQDSNDTCSSEYKVEF